MGHRLFAPLWEQYQHKCEQREKRALEALKDKNKRYTYARFKELSKQQKGETNATTDNDSRGERRLAEGNGEGFGGSNGRKIDD